MRFRNVPDPIATIRNVVSPIVTLDQSDTMVHANCVNNPVTIYLLPSIGKSTVTVRKMDVTSNIVTVVPYGTETIDDDTSRTLTAFDDMMTIIPVDTGWSLVDSFGKYDYSTSNHTYYVDSTRIDEFTGDGSITSPYKTLKAAVDVVNALAVTAIAIGTQEAYDITRYVIKVHAGIYPEDFTITNMKYLRLEMEGATISGDITIATTMIGGAVSDYYSRVEFVGGDSNRSNRGRCAYISGDTIYTRNNDSLMYVSYMGVEVGGNISIGTSSVSSHGTWVVCLENCYFSNSSGFISTYGGATDVMLLETYTYNNIKSHIANQDGSATNVQPYDCNGTTFDLINITPIEPMRIKSCIFSSTTSIVAVKTLYVDANSYKSLRAVTPTLTGITISELDKDAYSTSNHTYYVDSSRTDDYTEDGSIGTPYKTILAAQTIINALAVTQIALGTQVAYDTTRYTIKINAGIYADALAISNMKYLRYEMNGATISGNVTITTTMIGGAVSDYYSKVEFVGGNSNRANRGRCGYLSGDMILNRNNDSLMYLALSGIEVAGNISVGTALVPSDGTWVVCLENTYFSGSSKFISMYNAGATDVIILETYGYNKIGAHLAKQDGSATNIDLYDCNGTEFDLINITPTDPCKVKNCVFGSTTSIVAVKTLSIDANSYKSLKATAPTLTGMTISELDRYEYSSSNHTYYVDATRTDDYEQDGSVTHPYKTLVAAQTIINALANVQIALGTQIAYDTTRYTVKLNAGIYADAITITNMKYLRYEMNGATISGAIAINTTMIGGAVSDYYSKVEFVGGNTNRSNRGRCGYISGGVVFTRNNDSLMYLGFSGVDIGSNISLGTADTSSSGTWVICLENTYFSNSSAFVSSYNTNASDGILIESYGNNIFKSHLANQDGSATQIDLYDCNNTDFDLVNITPWNSCDVKNCRFTSTTSIVAVKNLSIDGNSYKSLMAQTPTLTGIVLKGIDGILPSSATVTVYTGVAVTRAAVRALLGDTPAQGSVFIGETSVGTTKPNMYVKVLAANGDTDWERIVTAATD